MNNNVSVKFNKTGKFAVTLTKQIEVEEDEVVHDLPADFGQWCEQEKVGEMVAPEVVEEDDEPTEEELEEKRLEEERLQSEKDDAAEEKRLEKEAEDKKLKEEEALKNQESDQPPVSDKKKAVKAGPVKKKISKKQKKTS